MPGRHRLDPELVTRILELGKRGLSAGQIARMAGVSKSSAYKYSDEERTARIFANDAVRKRGYYYKRKRKASTNP